MTKGWKGYKAGGFYDELITDKGSPRTAARQALRLLDLYNRGQRPSVSEIHIDHTIGYTLVLAATGARLVVGRGEDATFEQRLRRFDSAWTSLSPSERDRARTFFLDHTSHGRITIALAQ